METIDLISLLDELAASNEVGRQTFDYLKKKRVRVEVKRLPAHIGGLWTLTGGIVLSERLIRSQHRARLLSVLVHEVCHLKQGPMIALSVYGELQAWQVDFNFQQTLTGEAMHPLIKQLCDLPLEMNRTVLMKARDLMQAYAGKVYRVNWLPLFPLSLEVKFWLG